MAAGPSPCGAAKAPSGLERRLGSLMFFLASPQGMHRRHEALSSAWEAGSWGEEGGGSFVG